MNPGYAYVSPGIAVHPGPLPTGPLSIPDDSTLEDSTLQRSTVPSAHTLSSTDSTDPTDSTNSAAFPRQFARSRRFSLGVPRHFTVSPDGSRVLFVRTVSGTDPVGRLWQYEDGAERLVVDPALLVGAGGGPVPEEERLLRERARERSVGVVSYATDDAARLVAFALSGALWAVRTDGGIPFSVSAAGPVVDPRPSPDGRHIAYVSRRSFHVVDLTGADRQLACAEGPEISYGLAEYVAAESMHRLRGYWWAPDSRHVLVARVDTGPVERRYVSDPADPATPPQAIPYPAAGTPNAEVSLQLLSLEGERVEVDWDRKTYEYLVDAGWDAHGPYLAVQSRDQRIVRTLSVDPATGATEVLHERTDPAWVELIDGTPARTASGALVLPEDDGDTRYLTVNGRRVTPEGLQLCAVLGVEGERVLFTASEDPLETHVWCHEPGHGSRRLSRGPGRYTGVGRGGTVVLAGVTPRGNEVGVLRGTEPGTGTGTGLGTGKDTGTGSAGEAGSASEERGRPGRCRTRPSRRSPRSLRSPRDRSISPSASGSCVGRSSCRHGTGRAPGSCRCSSTRTGARPCSSWDGPGDGSPVCRSGSPSRASRCWWWTGAEHRIGARPGRRPYTATSSRPRWRTRWTRYGRPGGASATWT